METLDELEKIGIQLCILNIKANNEYDVINMDRESLAKQFQIITVIENCIEEIQKIFPNLE